MKRFPVAFLILVIAIVLPLQLQAQEVELPSVDPSACSIEPAEIVPPTDAGDLNSPSPTPSPIATDNASAADDQTAVAIIERIAQSIACRNAGDLPRMIANFSSGWIADRFSGYDLVFMQRFVKAAAAPEPLAESDRIELIAIENILIRGDGVAIATVTTRQHGTALASLLALVLEDGGWRIENGQVLETS